MRGKVSVRGVIHVIVILLRPPSGDAELAILSITLLRRAEWTINTNSEIPSINRAFKPMHWMKIPKKLV